MGNPIQTTGQTVTQGWWGFATSCLSHGLQDLSARVSSAIIRYIPTIALPEDLETSPLATRLIEEKRDPPSPPSVLHVPIIPAASLFPPRADRFRALRVTPLQEAARSDDVVEVPHSPAVNGALTVASWFQKALFFLAAQTVVAAPHLLEWVQRESVVPGQSTTEKVRKILTAFAAKKPHETLCVLGESVERAPPADPLMLRTRQSHYTTIRTRISSTREALEKSRYTAPLPQASPLPATAQPAKSFNDQKLCSALSAKAEMMSAIALLSSIALGTPLPFDKLKALTRTPDPLKLFFQELPFWPLMKARITFFFLRPLLASLFHYQSDEQPGLAVQFIRLLRERLVDPDLRRTLISTLLVDGASTAEDLRTRTSSLSPLSSDKLNTIFLTWLKSHFVIKTGWPLIGKFLDRFIQKKVLQFVEEQNIPQIARSLFDPAKQGATANPIVTRLLKLLATSSGTVMRKLQLSNAAELALLRSGTSRDHLDAPPGSLQASFYDNNGEPLNFVTVIRQLTTFFAIQGATDEAERRVYETRSRFDLYLRDREKKAPAEAELLASYVRELDELLTALRANRTREFNETRTISIKDKIEEQVDQIVPPLLHQSLSTIFDLLGSEETTEALLAAVVTAGEQLITEPSPSAEEILAQTEEFERASRDLRENIKQMITDVVELEFTPEVQKERVERSNLYAVQWSDRLRGELQDYIRNMFLLIRDQTVVTTSSHVEKLSSAVKAAGRATGVLLAICEKRLDQLYNAPPGAFSEDEIQRDMNLIEETVQQIAVIGQNLFEIESNLLSRLLQAHKSAETLQDALAHLSLSSERRWYTTLEEGLRAAGMDTVIITPFARASSSLVDIANQLTTLNQRVLILGRASAACNTLYKEQQEHGRNVAHARELAERAVRTAIAEGLLPPEALRQLTDNFSLGNFCKQREADLQRIEQEIDILTARKDAEMVALEHDLTALLKIQKADIVATNRRTLELFTQRCTPAIERIATLSTTLLKKPKVVVELLSDVSRQRLKPLVDGYLSFMGSSLQAFISSPRNLHLIMERQLDRLARRLS